MSIEIESEKTTVIIHHSDNDGRGSAAVAYRELKSRTNNEIMCIEMDYDRQLPELPKNIDKLYILDFSFGTDKFQALIDLVGRDNVIWIDHHISVIKKLEHLSDLIGRRTEKWSGIMLTWKWFHPNTEDVIPRVVELIDDYDRWAGLYGEDTLAFYEYSQSLNLKDVKGTDWDTLLDMTECELKPLIQVGKELKAIKDKDLQRIIKDAGIPITVQWKGESYSCLKVNSSNHKSTSQLGEMVYKDLGYDLFWGWFHKKSPITGELTIVNHMRSVKIDVSEIATKHGGGGHPNAGGFISKSGIDMNNYVEIL